MTTYRHWVAACGIRYPSNSSRGPGLKRKYQEKDTKIMKYTNGFALVNYNSYYYIYYTYVYYTTSVLPKKEKGKRVESKS